jgi:hypothetical protein
MMKTEHGNQVQNAERLNAELRPPLNEDEREAKLSYIRDCRDLLLAVGTQAKTPHAQAYRDRWSRLCRQLCDPVTNQPILTSIDGGLRPKPRPGLPLLLA